jgi:hypothetical protein
MAGNRIRRQLSLATRKELIKAISDRYHAAGRAEKKKVLDELVAVAGFHRKHAIRALRRSPTGDSAPQTVPRSRIYTEAVIEVLTLLWEAADRICGKRLKAAIPSLLDAMERHGHLSLDREVRQLVLTVSAATLDRLLIPVRNAGKQGRRRTGISTPLRKSVAVRTFTDWRDPPPGFFEMDMVAHCGKSVSGSYTHSLVLTDIASTWTVAAAMVMREQTLITATVEEIRKGLPFPLLGLDVDNDSAFINETLVGYCRERGIELTRSRAYKKNDQAWIEQKNGSVVRRMVGYGRLEGRAAAAELAALHDAGRLYVNFFLPSFKLATKTREGATVSRKYDRPATPCERLLCCEAVPEARKEELRETFASLDPVLLLSRIRAAQRRISELETGATSSVPSPDDQKLDRFVDSMKLAWKDGEARLTHRKPVTGPRMWRTRVDAFESSWSTVERWLGERQDATAKDLFQRLREESGIRFDPGQLRTLQRRVKQWRTEIARRLVFGVDAEPASTAPQSEEQEETVTV